MYVTTRVEPGYPPQRRRQPEFRVATMTKDGRPSRINDIRYFCGNMHSYLEGQQDAVAFGRRLAMFLNGEGFSLGAYPSLYIFLTPSLASGAVKITDYGGDWWQRYTHVGVPPEFPNTHDASDVVMDATVAALKAIRPDLATTVESADRIVRTHGAYLRFLLKTRQTKRFVVEISFSVGVWPKPSHVHTSLIDLSSGEFLDAPPLPITSYSDAFDYTGPIRISDIEKMRSEFVAKTRPSMSKLVKRRG
jgi:hypothetical protein